MNVGTLKDRLLRNPASDTAVAAGSTIAVAGLGYLASPEVAAIFGATGALTLEYLRRRGVKAADEAAVEYFRDGRATGTYRGFSLSSARNGLLFGVGYNLGRIFFGARSAALDPSQWDAVLYEDNFRYCTAAERAARTADGLREPSDFLNPEREVCGNSSSFANEGEFVRTIVTKLIRLGVPVDGAISIAAHLGLETGFGRSYNGNNIGGVGVSRGWVERYRAATGRDAPFWRAHGHTGQGDAPTMFFRAYPSIDAFLIDFVRTFAPRPQDRPDRPVVYGVEANYSGAGAALWSGGDWFREILDAGYRGNVTRAAPENSIASQRGLERTVRRLYTEAMLGLAANDIRSDPRLVSALQAYQQSRGLTASGEQTNETIQSMALAA